MCKWTYKCDGISQEWDRGFFKDVGLEDLAEDGWCKIGRFCEIVNLALEEFHDIFFLFQCFIFPHS